PDLNGKSVNEIQYRGMIGSLMYLTVPKRKRTLGNIELHFIPTQYQLADIFTKPLDEPTFKRLIVELGTNRNVLVDKTQYAKDRLGIVQTDVGTKNATNTEQEFDTTTEITKNFDEEIKLEDLSELVKYIGTEVMDLDTQEDDQPFMVLSNMEEEVHAEPHAETEGILILIPSYPKSIKIQELSTQVLLLQSQNIKLEKKKIASEVEVVFLSAQPSFPNVQQLIELLVKSLKPKLSQLLTDHDFSSSIPTEPKEVPSKVNDINRAVREFKKYIEEMEIEIPSDLNLSKLKVLDALPSLLNRVTEALDGFAQVIKSTS
ncbi:hypothetical protein Tco_0927448, partial [Tanacetum coccineum]